MINRLKLDWTLDSTEARMDFLQTYLQSPKFQQKELTPDEAEMCSNYVLWGKKSDGTSVVQDGDIQIRTRSGIWDESQPESLDSLTESPTFNEATLAPLSQSAQIRTKKETFSRQNARTCAPSWLLPIYEELWNKIDSIDLTINFYDLAHDRRKKPPREELLQRFSNEEIENFRLKGESINQFTYWKLRHELVELRNLQYTYRDAYSSAIQRHTQPVVDPFIDTIDIGIEIPVKPLGLFDNSDTAAIIYAKEYIPKNYSEDQLCSISSILWDDVHAPLELDFRNEEHVYNVLNAFYDLEDSGIIQNFAGTTKFLLRTLDFYIRKANFSEAQAEILDLKKKGRKNQQIADYINKKYGKTYSANYISTIFRQKIIKQICAAAVFHRVEIENIFYPENWKKCTSCGRLMLVDPQNFVRKSRSKDGYSNRCKCCDKLDRQRKKEKK